MRGDQKKRPANWTREGQIDAARRRNLALNLWRDGATAQQVADTIDPVTGGRLYSDRQAAHAAIQKGIRDLDKPGAEEVLAQLLARHNAAFSRAILLGRNADPNIQLRALAEQRAINVELAKLFGVYDLDAKLGQFLQVETARTVGAFQEAFVTVLRTLDLSPQQQAEALAAIGQELRSRLDSGPGPIVGGMIEQGDAGA